MRLELRRLELAKPEQTFNQMRDAARELLRDIEKLPKQKRSVVNHVTAADGEGVEQRAFMGIPEYSEFGVNNTRADAQKSGGAPMGEIVTRLEQLGKQQGQIAELLQTLLERSTNDDCRGDFRGRDKSRIRCYFCNRFGHVKAECRKRLAKEKTNQASAVEQTSPGELN